jgi:hypothetical protein
MLGFSDPGDFHLDQIIPKMTFTAAAPLIIRVGK